LSQDPQQQEEEEEDEGDGDAVLVTDADTPIGELITLQLILARWVRSVRGELVTLQVILLDRQEVWDV
jgi:hypothetical protein